MTTRLDIGTTPDGVTIARTSGGCVLSIARCAMCTFQVGDKIGWLTDDKWRDVNTRWAGTVVISEPDPEGWHVAWKTDDDPKRTRHWRGNPDARDTRWVATNEYVIQEQP